MASLKEIENRLNRVMAFLKDKGIDNFMVNSKLDIFAIKLNITDRPILFLSNKKYCLFLFFYFTLSLAAFFILFFVIFLSLFLKTNPAQTLIGIIEKVPFYESLLIFIALLLGNLILTLIIFVRIKEKKKALPKWQDFLSWEENN